jgi:hypothetical protein
MFALIGPEGWGNGLEACPCRWQMPGPRMDRRRGGQPLGMAVAAVTGCASSYPAVPSGAGGQAVPAGYNAHSIASAAVRIYGNDASHIGVLDLTEMSAPDAPGPSYPRCILRHSPADRMVSFDLNYHPLDFGPGTAPAVHVTLTGPDGAVMVAENHVRPDGTWTCASARSLYLSAEPAGWQLVYGLALPVSRRTRVRELTVRVDRQPITVGLDGTIYSLSLAP